MAADINSSDEEIITSHRRRLSSGNKRQRLTDSDEDSFEDNISNDNKHTLPTNGRRSDRIKRRQSREFRLPDKHAYRDQLQNTDVIIKSVTPKKRINNLTKVNNRYNADTYDTDEGDLSDFIVYDDEVDDDNESSEESDNESEKRKPKGRVDRNRTEFSASKRQRLREVSSSSDSETDIPPNKLTSNENGVSSLSSGSPNKEGVSVNESKKEENQTDFSSTNVGANMPNNSDADTNKGVNLSSRDSGDDSDSVPHTGSSNKKRQIMSSDSESNEDESPESEVETATSRVENRRRYRQELFKELKDSRKKSK